MPMLVSDCGRLGNSPKETPCLLPWEWCGVAGEDHQPHPRIFGEPLSCQEQTEDQLDQNKIISAIVLNKVW
jgi:hypothetical protein